MKQRKLLMKIIIKIAHPLIENTKLSKVEIYAELCPLIVQISKTLSLLKREINFLFMLPPQVVQSPPQPLFHQLACLPSHLYLHGSHHGPKQNNQKCQ